MHAQLVYQSYMCYLFLQKRAHFMADLLMLKFVLASMTRNRKNAEEVLAAVHCLLSSNLITFPTSAASPIPTTDPDTTLEEDEEHVRSNRFTGVHT